MAAEYIASGLVGRASGICHTHFTRQAEQHHSNRASCSAGQVWRTCATTGDQPTLHHGEQVLHDSRGR
jgi:hypothetical protein